MLKNYSVVPLLNQNSSSKFMRLLNLETTEHVLAKVAMPFQDNSAPSSVIEKEFELTKGLDSPYIL